MFRRKKAIPARAITQPQLQTRIEVEEQKAVNEKIAQEAVNASNHLSELLVKNGFTLTIVLAAHHSNKRSR